MAQFEWVHAAWLALAIVLEIVANVFLKFSDGFRRKIFGLLSLAAVLAAFSALSQAVKGIDLSVAYALWGRVWYCRHVSRRLDLVWSTVKS
ncbi:multidrug resistance protein [Escherichia coli]|nr:multidrug resistance protein [Escherichia coli]